ncbi:MAG TPA: hypothetical protein DCQ31_19250, partial [Bacteroidales bacterium]|nr:hypothetical protein [Bacteroidales bacterium]
MVLIDRHRIMPEYTHKNNRITNRKLLSKAEPFKLKFLGGFENDLKTVLYFIPTLGYNTSAGLMPGFTFHNGVFPQLDFEWQANIAYSFKAKLPQGSLNYRARLLRNAGIIKNMWYTGNLRSYAREYTDLAEKLITQTIRFRTGFEMQLNNPNPRNGHATFIKPEFFYIAFADKGFNPYQFGTLGVQHFITKTLNRFHFKAEAAWFE